MKYDYYYLVSLQYLGFRFSGWQRQPHAKTIESMLLKTLKFVLPGRQVKILGAGRTDAKVSALEAAFELFVTGPPIAEISEFIKEFNSNLPTDIKIIKIDKVNDKFNIINHCNQKEYIYLFSHNSKNHPFSAPFITGIQEKLDIDLMKEGANLFVGTHDFKAYTVKSSTRSIHIRSIFSCQIITNDFLRANFFPDESFALVIRAQGFLRYQVRMIMGALFQLGRQELSLEDIKASLADNTTFVLNSVAPASGLILNSLTFDKIG